MTGGISSVLALVPCELSVVTGAPIGLAAFLAFGSLAASLRRRGWREGDTRKIFHFGIFTIAAVLRIWTSIEVLAAYGFVVVAGVLITVAGGEGNPIFEAIARKSDRPARKLHVLVPLACTAAGGVLSHIVAGPLQPVALLVGGWGDAVGEPIGTRYPIRSFKVRSIGGVSSTKSIGGTSAIFLASCLAVWVATSGAASSLDVIGIAAVGTVVEVCSPHGIDNLTVMLAAAVAARFLL